ncbi:MAG: DUF1294 domain-containing protein [Clostridia bacterium]
MGKIKTHRRNRNVVIMASWGIALAGWFTGYPSYIGIGFLLLNIYAFWLMQADKHAAKSGAFRIPERSLLAIGALGGALGMFAGMQVFRHKTQHAAFTYGVPAFLLLQAVLSAALYRYLG